MAILLEQLARHGSVTLEGYGHQVGGQFRLMKFGDCVCKPVFLRENMFYQSLSDELKAFTATYHGVVTVCFKREASGEIKMVAYPHQEGGSVLNKKELKANAGFSESSLKERVSVGSDQAYMSPWCELCTKVSTEKLKALGVELDSIQQEYIVLENLTSRFTRPSVLDLKVGFGNHGDYDTEEKRLKHLHNKQNSTTGTLHVRVSGMQKYDAAQNEYIFRDKYYGRGLSEEGFREELQFFLHNGVQFRADLLTDVIAMLEELVKVVQRQDSYRFFSSSLLIIYDGAECPEEGCGSTRTNGTATPSLSSQQHTPLSEKSSQSLDIANGSSHLKDEHTTLSPPSGASNGGDKSHDDHMINGGLNSRLARLRRKVDIRMIDFAHGIHSSFRDSALTGCDDDYLHGLKALLSKFRELSTTA